MKFKFVLNTLSLILCSTSISQAQQNWMQLAEKTSNFYEIKAAFLKENETQLKTYYQNLRKGDTQPPDETYQAEHETEEYQNIIHFMRIAEWVEPRVSETNGDMDALIESDYRARLAQQKELNQRAAANWSVIGPINTDNMYGNGRVNSIIVDPNNATTLYACTPAGQLWKSTNNGGSWAVISSGIPAAGVTNVAIDPTNSNILYALTGDADRAIYHPSSKGLYKSTNGGASWATTGLSYSLSNGVVLTNVLIHPQNPNIILVSGTNGIRRSTNGGTSFTQVSTSSIRELAFNPQNPETVYAGSKSGAVLLRSYDSGATWTQITSGLPTSATAVRFAIDISPADTNYVYVMATNSSDNMQGFYQSIDGGTTFTQKATTSPNIPNGQGWYNLCVAADPMADSIVYAAGLNVYRSTNGGATWTSLSGIHVDVHDLQFNGTDLLASSDGGVYRRTGSSWTNISSNLAIAQPYGIGLSPSNADMIVSGHQDNGTNLTTNLTSWKAVSGGDGMISFIDRTNTNRVYCTYQNGVLRRSTNGGTNFSNIQTITGGYWVTPFIQDPIDANTLYAGGDQLNKSIDGGTTWTTISPANGQVRWIDVCRTNNQIIYYCTSSKVYKTTDGGTNWTDVSGTVPTTTHLHVHIDVNDPNAVYVSIASTSSNQVYYTSDGGTTWTNISSGLPAVSANTITTQIGLLGAAYCGTDLGVYYRNPSVSTTWQSYNTGLPSVPVRDLEIHYASGKILAATFGRSLWESSLDQVVIPVELVNFQGQLCDTKDKNTDGTSRDNREGVLLTWQTASELRFSHFEVERSIDSKSWAKLIDQTAKGTANGYQTIDDKPVYGINYYRLKMVDNDGSFTYSKTVAIEWTKPSSKQWTVFPNPVKNKLYLTGNEDISGEQSVQVLDITGKIVLKTTINQVRNGLSVSDLTNGSYILDIKDKQENECKTFVIER